jgi:predicted MFS family arabinose efflux permease
MSAPSSHLASFPAHAESSPVVIALAGLIALAVAMGIGRFAFTPILPMMQQDAGLSIERGGWLASANYAGYLLGALLAIRMRVAPTLAVRAALVAITLGTLAMGVTDGFGAWLALRLIAGIASAWVLIFASASCLERLAPFGRPLLGGAVFAGVGTGIAVAGLVCLALMTAGLGSRPAWLALGVLALLGTAGTWRAIGTPAPRRAEPTATPTRARWEPGSGRLVACYGVFGFGYIIPATFVPAMARQAVHDPLAFGWSWPVFGVAAALSTLAATAFPLAADHRRLWIRGHLVMAAGVALPVVWPGLAGIMIAALLVGGTFVVVTMAGMQEGRRVGGAAGTRLMAAMTSAFAAGQVAGPLLAGQMAGLHGGFDGALLLAAVLLVASAAALARGGGGA